MSELIAEQNSDPALDPYNELKEDIGNIFQLLDIENLSELRGLSQQDALCSFCINSHALSEYTEMSFISDLIQDQGCLYGIIEWARVCALNWPHTQINKPKEQPDDVVWNLILEGKIENALGLVSDEQRRIVRSLRPYGEEPPYSFDFMMCSGQSMDWFANILALQSRIFSGGASRILRWAACDVTSVATSNFYEYLWLRLRSYMRYRVLTRYAELQPRWREVISFGYTEPIQAQLPQQETMGSPGFYDDEGIKSHVNHLIFVLIQKKLGIIEQTKDDVLELLEKIIQEAKQNAYVHPSKPTLYFLYQSGMLLVKLELHDEDDQRLLIEIVDLLQEQNKNQEYRSWDQIKWTLDLIQYLRRPDKIADALQSIPVSQEALKQFRVLIFYYCDQEFAKRVVQTQFTCFLKNHPEMLPHFLDDLSDDALSDLLESLLKDPLQNQKIIEALMNKDQIGKLRILASRQQYLKTLFCDDTERIIQYLIMERNISADERISLLNKLFGSMRLSAQQFDLIKANYIIFNNLSCHDAIGYLSWLIREDGKSPQFMLNLIEN